MQALKLFELNKISLPYKLGEELGYGIDGQVFEIAESPDKVIKLSVIYDFGGRITDIYFRIANILNHVMDYQPSTYVHVYEHAYVDRFIRSTYNGDKKYILHYYVMEKLLKISEDEKKVFHTILSHEDRNIIKNYSEPDIKKILSELGRGLDFDEGKVIIFYNSFKDSKIIQNDLHPRNIMKNKYGEFKMIDLDKCQLTHGE